jgi:hypothetical protein
MQACLLGCWLTTLGQQSSWPKVTPALLDILSMHGNNFYVSVFSAAAAAQVHLQPAPVWPLQGSSQGLGHGSKDSLLL